MSHPCAIADCKRVSRALCHCCQQNLCRDHLNQHDDQLNSQLNPFVDEVNQLSDVINRIEQRNLIEHAYQKLEQWRLASYKKIDEYVDEKKHELEQKNYLNIDNLRNGINILKEDVYRLIKRQDTTIEDVRSISTNIQTLRRYIAQLEHEPIDFNLHPLELDKTMITIGENMAKIDFNLAQLMPPQLTKYRSRESSKPLACNNKFLLMHCDNQLCLMNQDLTVFKTAPWTYGWIWDTCWSSTLSRFFIVTLNHIFTLESHTMLIEPLQIAEQCTYNSCTCSEKSLYVSTEEPRSVLYEFSFMPKIALINQWQPEHFCQNDDHVQDIVFHKGALAFIIANKTSQTKRMELRYAQTLEPIWCIQFAMIDRFHNPLRLCLFNCDEWLVLDWKTSQIFHITRDGQIKSSCSYEPIPYRCCQFGQNTLVISARNSINFHKL